MNFTSEGVPIRSVSFETEDKAPNDFLSSRPKVTRPHASGTARQPTPSTPQTCCHADPSPAPEPPPISCPESARRARPPAQCAPCTEGSLPVISEGGRLWAVLGPQLPPASIARHCGRLRCGLMSQLHVSSCSCGPGQRRRKRPLQRCAALSE